MVQIFHCNSQTAKGALRQQSHLDSDCRLYETQVARNQAVSEPEKNFIQVSIAPTARLSDNCESTELTN